MARNSVEKRQQQEFGASFFPLAINSSVFHMYHCHILCPKRARVKGLQVHTCYSRLPDDFSIFCGTMVLREVAWGEAARCSWAE
jgi:hypothetical protein